MKGHLRTARCPILAGRGGCGCLKDQEFLLFAKSCQKSFGGGAFSACGPRKLSLNSASPKRTGLRQRGTGRFGVGGDADGQTSEDCFGWLHHCYGVAGWFLSLCSLTSVDEEGICGRFGRFGGGSRAYRPARGSGPDDAGVSFTVLAWLSLDGLAGTETDPGFCRGRCAKVRRQGHAEGISGRYPGSGFRMGVPAHFNLRV